jgi:hypothetical protein
MCKIYSFIYFFSVAAVYLEEFGVISVVKFKPYSRISHLNSFSSMVSLQELSAFGATS